ncbi:hypothetical protein ABZ281_36070, partial [Streptomyces sp. NPDC006265]
MRLTNDQIVENATGVGAPPTTWPRAQLVVDVLYKTAHGFATGAVADTPAARNVRGPALWTWRLISAYPTLNRIRTTPRTTKSSGWPT